MKMVHMLKREIVWDLSEIFPSTADYSVQKAIESLARLANDFAKRYKGKINRLSAKEMLECIKNFEDYFSKLETITVFASLSFAANMTDPDTMLLNYKVKKTHAELDRMLTFFNIELGGLVHENPRIINERILKNYNHFLERIKRQNPHNLLEAEEKLIIEKDQFGINAWQELQGKMSNSRLLEVEIEGKRKTLSMGEAYGLTFVPDRHTRESATKAMLTSLGKDGEIFASALRNICNDWLTVCERRKYDSPMEASLITNDIDQQTINNLLTHILNHTELYHRYMKLKAKILKLKKLHGHDVHAPPADAPNAKYDYDKASKLIIEAYSRFDTDYASAVKDMFAKKHIDATPRLGKMLGGRTYRWYEGKSAFVRVDFNGTLNDVYMLAHELGHATHMYYYSRNQTILNCGTPLASPQMILAETASIFGELLLTDLLKSQTESDEEWKAILCGILDSANLEIYETITMELFEQSLYDMVKRGEYLDYKTICRCYVEARDRICGNTVEFSTEEEAFWTAVPHCYMPNFRFYNYPYAYAQLFVYALYQQYLEEGKKFVPKFKKVLSAGFGTSPVEIGEIFGLDITDSHFWEIGLKRYERFLEELEKIVY
jgi:oligoendopeptidase F